MSRRKVIRQHFGDAFIGWGAGVTATVILGLLWPIFFPAIVNVDHYYGAGPGMLMIVGLAILAATPAALLGGLIGGALAIEGGDRGRRTICILLGVLFSLPCSVWGYWFFTGY